MSSSKKAYEFLLDINIKLVSESDEKDGYENSNLKLNIAGKSISYVIVSTLRRVILALIPTYCFDSSNINISKNSSVFNNDYMRLRLSNFPIYINKNLNEKYKKLKNLKHNQIINPETTLEKATKLEYIANLGTAEIETYSNEDVSSEDITDNLTIVMNVKNTSENDTMNIMTNSPGVKYYLGKEQISHIYSNPLLIIQLQPGQEFACTMVSSLNIAMYNAIFRPCSICAYDEINENNYDFLLMSKRQISEKDLIIRACKIIVNKVINAEQVFINNIKKYNIGERNIDNDEVSTEYLRNGTIIIEGEQHTLGNLLSKYLQDHKDITFAAYKVGHPNVNQVEIKYMCKTSILNIIKEVSSIIQEIYRTIEKKMSEMPDIGYKYI